MTARYLALSAMAVCAALACAQAETPPAKADQPGMASANAPLLDPADFAPERVFPAPPPRNSAVEMIELRELTAMRAAASPERRAQADRDGKNETPSIFNDAAARDLTHLPATYALLTRIQGETERVVTIGKDHFRRLRPYGIDPKLDHCGKGKVVDRSYPSGHSGFVWSVGWTLARLMPDRASAILARAQDYTLSREICAVHFRSDIEASHAVAVLIAERLLADPRLAASVAAARAELARP